MEFRDAIFGFHYSSYTSHNAEGAMPITLDYNVIRQAINMTAAIPEEPR